MVRNPGLGNLDFQMLRRICQLEPKIIAATDLGSSETRKARASVFIIRLPVKSELREGTLVSTILTRPHHFLPPRRLSSL